MPQNKKRINDIICTICLRSKIYAPLCPGHGGSSGGDTQKSDSSDSKQSSPTDHATHHGSHAEDTTSSSDDSKYLRFTLPALKKHNIFDLLKLLEIIIGLDGTLTLQILPGITKDQLTAIKQLLLEISKGGPALDAFNFHLQKTKGISLSGYHLKLTLENNKLFISIPDAKQRQKFLSQFNKYLEEKSEPEPQFSTPFRMNPFTKRLTR